MSPSIPPNEALCECSPRPTMQWLAEPVVSHLDGLVKGLRDEVVEASRSDVVGALVLAFEPGSPEEMWDTIRPSKTKFARPKRRSTDGARPIKLDLPAPISNRVDGLVELTRRHAVVYRHDLITALIMAMPKEPDLLVENHWAYRRARAAAAALPGRGGRQRVLRDEPPRPGPRRWRPARVASSS